MNVSTDGKYVYCEASRARPNTSEMLDLMSALARFVRARGITISDAPAECRDNDNGTLTIRYKVVAMD